MSDMDQESLQAKAFATADLLIEAIGRAKLVDAICDSYVQACKEHLSRLGVKQKAIRDEELKRLRFEVVAFTAFIIMGQEVEKHITRKKWLLGSEPDVEGMQYFYKKLSNRLWQHLRMEGITKLQEVVVVRDGLAIKFGVGEPLDLDRRVADYLQMGTSLEASQRFGPYLSRALKDENLAIFQIIGMSFVESVVNITRVVLASTFTD